MKRVMLYLLSLILITAQAGEFDVISKPVELPSSEEVVVELLIPTDVIVQLPTEEPPVIGDGEAEINEDSSVEPMDVVPDDAAEVIQPTVDKSELSAVEDLSTPEPVEESVYQMVVSPTPEPTPSLPPDVSIPPESKDVPLSTDEPSFTPEAVVSPPPEPDVEQTAAPIMFMVTCHATRTSITYTFTPVEGDPP